MLNKTYADRRLADYEEGYYRLDYFDRRRQNINPANGSPLQRNELFSTPGLQKSGSITRGISFGSRQSVFANSSLNLQLEGKLSKDIELTAVFSDQNVPFQPEGNTAQIQDLDRIFIQLRARQAALSAGDIVLQKRRLFAFCEIL